MYYFDANDYAMVQINNRSYRTNSHDSIYDYLFSHTNDHDFAANVASWAEVAGIGEEFENEYGYTIRIYDI